VTLHSRIVWFLRHAHPQQEQKVRGDVGRANTAKVERDFELSEDPNEIICEVALVLWGTRLDQSPDGAHDDGEVPTGHQPEPKIVGDVRPVQLGGVVKDNHGDNGTCQGAPNPHRHQRRVLHLPRHLVEISLDFGRRFEPQINQDCRGGPDRGDEVGKYQILGPARTPARCI